MEKNSVICNELTIALLNASDEDENYDDKFFELEEFLEEDLTELLPLRYYRLINLKELKTMFSDERLRKHLRIKDSISINDEIRLFYARVIIREYVEDVDFYDKGYIGAVKISDGKSKSAYFGFVSSDGGYHEWMGLWESKEALFQAVYLWSNMKYWITEISGVIPDEIIFKLWDKRSQP